MQTVSKTDRHIIHTTLEKRLGFSPRNTLCHKSLTDLVYTDILHPTKKAILEADARTNYFVKANGV